MANRRAKLRDGWLRVYPPPVATHALCAAALLLLGACAWPRPSAPERPAVRSLEEIRTEVVVLQQWDLSCAAAALATILTYQHGDPTSEREVAVTMMARPEYLANPDLVRARQGFSLLDMKRFVERRGYTGVGLGKMDFDALVARAPAIVPINRRGYQHFVVFRGAAGDRVLLADPAFGSHTVTRAEFEDMWIDYPEFGRVGFIVEAPPGTAAPNRLAPRPDDFLTFG
jgi:predicted double-glycine peptidase